MENKHFIGEHLYLVYPYTGTKNPYTIIGFKGEKIIVQEAECIFPYPRYFDTLPDKIVENPNGEIVTLFQSKSKAYKGCWVDKGGSYPHIAVFGRWDYEPYLD